MGRKGQPKTGGRQRGSMDKKVLARLQHSAAHMGEIRKQGKPKAIDALDQLLNLALGAATRLQQDNGGQTPLDFNSQFWRFVELGGTFAMALAKYQSATFKAIQIVPTVEIPPPKRDEGNVVTIDDPAALQRMYLKAIGKVQTG